MADGPSREERVLAGLKKLKQFQQRGNKRNGKGKSLSKANIPVPDTEDTNSKPVPINSKNLETVSKNQNSTGLTDCCDVMNENVGGAQSNTISTSTHSLSSNSASVNDLSYSKAISKSLEEVPYSKLSPSEPQTKELSSTESIRQISQQVNGLMTETHALLNGSVEQETSDIKSQTLARRNQELAAQLNSVKQLNEQLQYQGQELKAKNNRLLKEFEQEKLDLLEKSHKDQVALKDQLQVHIQTIGILVAEKTELQSSLSLSQQTAKQKAGEVEELQGRLRASRQHTNDLERELSGLTSSCHQFEKDTKENSKEIDRLKLENYKINKINEDLQQQLSELREKLNKKIIECQSIESDLSDTRNKLSISELQLQQLSLANNTEDASQIEELHQEKILLEKQAVYHKESIEKLINERDQMSEQYQLYVQQLSQQVASLRDELKQMSFEKDALAKEKSVLQEKLEAIEKFRDSSSKENPSELKLKITVLEKQKIDISKDLETQVSDNAQMSKLIQEQEVRIAELEAGLSRLKDEEVDKARLLETMQSDKVAASRAVSQNRELKKQLEELQKGFVLMSNDKLNLTEKLLAENHITKEQGERLSQQEEELQELRDQLMEREKRLENLEKSNTKGLYQQNQIADRMRHYEAQGQLAEMLQKELAQAQERINVVANQNTELRMALAKQAEATTLTDASKEDKDSTKRNDLVASLSVSVRQLEMERDQMMRQLDEQRLHRTELEAQIKRKENQINQDLNDDVIYKDEHAMMKKAMIQLEERFKQTMNQIAELSDEKQQLEHLVLQLQGETETIGDYIALYQIQRGLMRKKADEKDDYIAQLARDRENLKDKLKELQDLVVAVMKERMPYPKESLSLPHFHSENSINTPLDFVTLNGDDSNRSKTNAADVDAGELQASVNSDNVDSLSGNSTKKIMELLTEIGSSNLIEKPVADNFHPCPFCSGRLIIV